MVAYYHQADEYHKKEKKKKICFMMVLNIINKLMKYKKLIVSQGIKQKGDVFKKIIIFMNLFYTSLNSNVA